ncbi:MAG: glutamine-hydrolyzing carbamoyl-phosphate synthase small subunit [Methylacidiphilales bacterium]|nr:glutamine-hydrolyzing carbamoyl-phosphate synthase small subunit [Candidatus Methylacidiphilales bacterium]
MNNALLALEDGSIWRGQSFGAPLTVNGEVCFNTSMTGYQEILTDPSYKGQIVTMTYPLIGNTGVNLLDVESTCPHAAGLIVRELSPQVSSWRSTETLDSYLKRNNIPGLTGIDTRSLTLRLRTQGSLRGVMTSEKLSDAAAVDLAKKWSYLERDFVKEVTCAAPYDWDPEDKLSREWTLIQGKRPAGAPPLTGEDYLAPLPPVKYRIAAFDFGLKINILRRLRQHGFQVRVLPATTTADEALSTNPDGIFLSNGPGDPAVITYAHKTVQSLIGKKPIFGICLGHQILGYALGGKTFKLKFGHRGGNQPVKDLTTGKISITSQNHGFAVDPKSLPASEVETTQINLNDMTSEGLRHKVEPVFSVQYHPEAAPGPHDANYFFREFGKMIDNSTKN